MLLDALMSFFFPRAVAMGIFLALSASCGGAMEAQKAPTRPLPEYAGRAAELFDDGIEPGAVGYAVGASTSVGDKLLPERTGASDGVLRARVVTVTSKQEERGRSLMIGLHPVETLAGRNGPTADFTLTVSPHAPSAGILHAMEDRLVGLGFVVFVRGFARAGEADGELHFHIGRDDQDEASRIREADALNSFR
jgi:hypothetical protein